MTKPRVNILYAPGTNCHVELAEAFRLAGGDPVFIHLTEDLLGGRKRLMDCDILALPGGWSFGDHIAGGRIVSVDLLCRAKDQLQEIQEKGIPVLGVCNGFQILMDTGLLPGGGELGPSPARLDRNGSAVFESRWITLHVEAVDSIWTRGLAGQALCMPVAHGEGRLLLPDDFDDNRTVFRYSPPPGTTNYPANPNASPDGRAGICDVTGRIAGLMPHPERAIYPWLGSNDGIKIFRSGVDAVR